MGQDYLPQNKGKILYKTNESYQFFFINFLNNRVIMNKSKSSFVINEPLRGGDDLKPAQVSGQLMHKIYDHSLYSNEGEDCITNQQQSPVGLPITVLSTR